MSRKIVGVTVGTPINPDKLAEKIGATGVEEVYIGDNPPDTAKVWIDLDEEPTVLATLQAIQNDVTRAIQSVEGYDEGYQSGYQQGLEDAEPNLEVLNATENNKEYTPSGDFDGFSSVTVNVPERYDEGYNKGFTDSKTEGYEEGHTEGYNKGVEDTEPDLRELTATENITYEPNGFDGYNSVTVNVPLKYDEGYNDGFSEGKKDGYNEGYQASQDSIIYQEKTVDIAENGTTEVLPDEGKTLSKVTVNVDVESDGGVGIDGIPKGYARADYIQFTGKELVDTGIIGNQDTQINTCFTWESSTQRHLFGCASSDNTASITSYMNGSWRFGNKYASKNLTSKNGMLPYSALINKTTISLNSSLASISGVNDFETVGSLLLGGARDSDGTLPTVMITGKVFFFYIWQGAEMVLKLIPVVNEEGQYRFFDLVSKTFFDSITDTPLDGGNL